jgi:uncharacterized membrane protein
MDDLSTYGLILCVIGFILIAPIVALVRISRLNRRSANRDELERLQKHVEFLDRKTRDLEAQIQHAPATTPASPSVTPPPVAAEPPPPAQPIQPPPPPAYVPPVPAVALPTAAPTSWPRPPATLPETPRLVRAGSSPFGESVASSGSGPDSAERWANLEERLGANWLNKIGTAVFVIGIALFLSYTIRHLGPAGKIALGYAAGLALIALGILGERRERYRLAARSVLGGGWAVVYFATYAMHSIAAVRLVQSPELGFALLFMVAAVMVAHSLRYHSQVTTGFAYLLAFASVAVNQISEATLVASAILAASLVLVQRKRKWYGIEPAAIAATYLIHWLWLQQIFAAIGGHKLFPQFHTSVALLTIYWAIWIVSYFLRPEGEGGEKFLLMLSFLLNAAGYLAILHEQSFYPRLRFWFLLGAGVAYLALALVASRRARRSGFILTTTLGAAMLAAAIPYRYSGGRLEILWLLETEAFLIAGWRLAEVQLRRLGWAIAAALTIYVLYFDVAPRYERWRPPSAADGLMMLTLGVVFFLNARLAPRLLAAEARTLDALAADTSQGIATAFLLAAAWMGLPFLWVGVAWTAIGVAMTFAVRRADDRALRICGHFAVALGVIRLLSNDMPYAVAHPRLIFLTVGGSALLLGLISRRLAPVAEPSEGEDFAETCLRFVGGVRGGYTWTAALLVTLLAWNELSNGVVGLAWGLLGLALFELSRTLKERAIAQQSTTLLALSFVRIFIADLNATETFGRFSAKVITVSLLAAIYYHVAWAAKSAEPRKSSACLWFGWGALVALMRFELPLPWIALGWAVFTVILFLTGRWAARLALRQQAYLLTLLLAARCAFDNFYLSEPWHFTTLRVASVVAVAVPLYFLLGVALRKRHATEGPVGPANLSLPRRAANWLDANAGHLFFFAPTLLLTVLITLEVRSGYLTAAWGLEAVVIFVATLRLGVRGFRWFSLGLLLLSVGRIVSVDVWTLDALGRIVSFLGLGAALLLVSYLYARHKEFLSRYL